MKLGVTGFLTDQTIFPIELARAVEERGFSSLYFPEHTHIPTCRRTPCPTGEPMAEEYKRTLDPYIALAAAAAVTSRIELGTGVSLIAQHDPVVLAKTIATLDLISRGRFVLGLGFGWNVEEMADHGVEFRTRRERTREHLRGMQALWREEKAGFEGEFVRFAESWSWPKPLRSPGPPVLIGGTGGPRLFAHVAEYADGWLPIGGAGIKAMLPQLHEAAHRAGRDPARIRVVPFGTVPDRGKLAYYEKLGIDEVVLRVPGASRDEVLRALDGFMEFLE